MNHRNRRSLGSGNPAGSRNRRRRVSHGSRLLAVLCLTIVSPSVAAERLFDTSPFSTPPPVVFPAAGFLALHAGPGDLVEPGRWQIGFVQSASNTFVQSAALRHRLREQEERRELTLEEFRATAESEGGRLFHLDGELYRTDLSIRRGISERLDVGLTIPFVTIDGGVADEAIEQFHMDLDLRDDPRPAVPRDRVQVYLRRGEFERFVDRETGSGMGDAILSARWRAVSEGLVRVTAVGMLKLPTGDADALRGTGGVDLGAQLVVSRAWSRMRLYGQGGVLLLQRAPVLGTPDQVLFAGVIGSEVWFGSRAAAVVELSGTQNPLRKLEIDELEEDVFGFHLGLQVRLNDRVMTFVGLTENIVNFRNSVDVALRAGVVTRF